VFGTGRLRIVEEHMNQQQYQTILENRLIPQLDEWASNRGVSGTGYLIFMHDGAPYTTKFVQSRSFWRRTAPTCYDGRVTAET